MTLQYIIIGLLTIGAILFLYRKFKNSFKGDCSSGGCASSGCSSKVHKQNTLQK